MSKMSSRQRQHVLAAALCCAVVLCAVPRAAFASEYSIASPDRRQIFYGSAAGFDKPAEIDYAKVIEATPEYKEVKKKKIQRGTGRFWILMSQASERAVRAIADVGRKTDNDLIARSGYLGSLEPPIPAVDVTKLVLKVIAGEPIEDETSKDATSADKAPPAEVDDSGSSENADEPADDAESPESPEGS